jgi:hypothetical protein
MLVAPETLEPIIRAPSRAQATVHANECLVALRRWQLTHRELPRSLLIAVKDAGLKSVPTDPYDAKPLRFVVLGGEPVVCSVGRDRKDDGRLKDSKYDAYAGDLLYRRPAVEEHRKIRPAHYERKPQSLQANDATRLVGPVGSGAATSLARTFQVAEYQPDAPPRYRSTTGD